MMYYRQDRGNYRGEIDNYVRMIAFRVFCGYYTME